MSTPTPREVGAFKREVRRWAARIGVQPSGLYVQRMTRKWGSCSTGGRVCFARDLICRPARHRREVIVHELIHLRVRNHGSLFRALAAALLGARGRSLGGRMSRCYVERPAPSRVRPARPR